jgi:hypothetical protein
VTAKRNAAGGGVSMKHLEQHTQPKNTPPSRAAQRRGSRPIAPQWRVVIDGKTRGMPFGAYVSRAGALAMVRLLHAQGMSARVLGPAS